MQGTFFVSTAAHGVQTGFMSEARDLRSAFTAAFELGHRTAYSIVDEDHAEPSWRLVQLLQERQAAAQAARIAWDLRKLTTAFGHTGL